MEKVRTGHSGKKYKDRKQSDPNKRFHQGRSSSYAQMAYR